MHLTSLQEFKKNWDYELGVLLNVNREVIAVIENVDNLEVAIREEMAYSEEFPFKFISFEFTKSNYSCTIEIELADEEDVWTETFYLYYAVKY